MASTHAKAVRRAEVLERLSTALGFEQADLTFNARGDPEMALIITLERIADAVDAKLPAEKAASKAAAVRQVEQELEAETGSDFAQTSSEPPTLAETDKPATSGVPKGKAKP